MSRILIISFVIFTYSVGLGFIVPLTPYFKIHFQLSHSQIGLLGAMFPISQIIASPIIGVLSDIVGRKKIILISLFILSLSYIMMAFAKSYEIVLLSRFIGGFFASSMVAARASAADISTKENRIRYMSYVGLGFGFGFMLGPALGGMFAGADISHVNIYLVCFSAFFLTGCSAIITALFLKESYPKEKRQKFFFDKEFFSFFKDPISLFNFSLTGTIGLAMTSIEIFSGVWLASRFHFTAFEIGALWTLIALFMNLGRIFLTRNSKGYLSIMRAFILLLCGVLGLTVSFNVTMVIMCMALIGTAAGTLFTTINAKVSLKTKDHQQGLAFGMNNTIASIGRMIGPLIVGIVVDITGKMYAGWLSIAFFIGIAILISYFLSSKEIKTQKD